ncbi:RNA polymerase sigma factor [Singulisphaera acidiphila]|uniref:RNA polymerase sigma factor, sigma-70 family n=1 Tax=Singulisphaera acidiphila (strain ATCC BAA-1392 / DSM 18658 / VKM B-2454 / MOB10) TaxID=886293 RepID=L0DJM8_SINAD|nr:RNA polymerase sigma factor [Singulisphaera acidiphila]AGA29050.1 RNA polymerase sigma factor, sigma-70 family [Singulisphaera acidiphila DSM 18658]
MEDKWSNASLREFQSLFGGGVVSGLTDRQLLERFAERRDEVAFAGLIDRHGSMVLGVCRRVLSDPADAGDAFQATFLVLVRRAASVRVDDSLGPWLYGVSIRVAKRARTVANRRRRRERTNMELPEPATRGADPDVEMRLRIDEELQRLPARYRSAILLCYFEGLTHEEIARRLSCPVGTVRSRLARGRDLLRSRLERRGLAPGAPILTSVLVPASGWPELLSTTTVQAATRLVAGRSLAGVVPVSVEILVDGVMRTMVMTKVAILTSLLAGTLIGIATYASQEVDSRPPASHRQVTPIPRKEPIPKPAVAGTTVLALNLESSKDDAQEDAFEGFPAVVVKTVPSTGTTDVDPRLKEIQVTFSKEMMNKSWSWAQHSKKTFPELAGEPSYTKDERTCVLPVKLVPNKTYAIWLNSPKFGNFKDAEGRSAVPYLLVFRTKGS